MVTIVKASKATQKRTIPALLSQLQYIMSRHVTSRKICICRIFLCGMVSAKNVPHDTPKGLCFLQVGQDSRTEELRSSEELKARRREVQFWASNIACPHNNPASQKLTCITYKVVRLSVMTTKVCFVCWGTWPLWRPQNSLGNFEERRGTSRVASQLYF